MEKLMFDIGFLLTVASRIQDLNFLFHDICHLLHMTYIIYSKLNKYSRKSIIFKMTKLGMMTNKFSHIAWKFGHLSNNTFGVYSFI